MAKRNSAGSPATPTPPNGDVPQRSGADGRRTSVLSLDSVDYVTAALSKAHAIIVVAGRAGLGVGAKDETLPGDDKVLVTMTHASRLLNDCLDYLERAPEFRLGPLCATDPWWSDLQEGAALVDVFDAVTWAAGAVVEFSDDVTANYLWAIQGAIERAQSGLSLAWGEAEVRHG